MLQKSCYSAKIITVILRKFTTLPLYGTLCCDMTPHIVPPTHTQADRLTHTAELFSSTSIADWILPTLYSGHVGGVVWLKPPWAEQIPDGEYCLIVGKDKSSGHVRYNEVSGFILVRFLENKKCDFGSTNFGFSTS